MRWGQPSGQIKIWVGHGSSCFSAELLMKAVIIISELNLGTVSLLFYIPDVLSIKSGMSSLFFYATKSFVNGYKGQGK